MPWFVRPCSFTRGIVTAFPGHFVPLKNIYLTNHNEWHKLKNTQHVLNDFYALHLFCVSFVLILLTPKWNQKNLPFAPVRRGIFFATWCVVALSEQSIGSRGTRSNTKLHHRHASWVRTVLRRNQCWINDHVQTLFSVKSNGQQCLAQKNILFCRNGGSINY